MSQKYKMVIKKILWSEEMSTEVMFLHTGTVDLFYSALKGPELEGFIDINMIHFKRNNRKWEIF